MKHYRIEHSTDKKDIGKFPQVETGIGHFLDDPKYIGNQCFFLKNIDTTPILPELVLYKSSKITDLVSSVFGSTSTELVISNELKKIIENFSSENAQLFKIKLHHNKLKYEDYWLLHPSKTNNDFIDFPNSEIWLSKSLIKHERRYFDTAEEFYNAAKSTMYPETLHIYNYKLKDNLSQFFVLIYIDGGVGYFVSEDLKNEIEQAACTGIVFKEPNERYP